MDTAANGPRRAATVKDVARVAGVSIASVSRVINGTAPVAPSTRTRVTEAIARLHYVPHQGAASLVRRRHGVVGLLLPEMPGDLFAELIRGIEDGARRAGRHLLIGRLTGDHEEAARTLATLNGHVDGLLLMAPDRPAEALAARIPADLPTVLMNTRVDSAQSALYIDDYGAVMDLMRHLKDRGRRCVAHIMGPEDNRDAEERARGWRDALAMYWPGVDAPCLQGDFEEESGREAGRVLARMAERPDAVFAANDLMAAGAMHSLLEAGLSVPDDVAVVGFDDIPLASLLRPALTTVRVDVAELGRRALERLLEVIEAPERPRERLEPVKPTLVVRESSVAASAPVQARA